MSNCSIPLQRVVNPSAWCASRKRRCIDFAVALSGLLALAPIIVVISLAILVTSGRPVFFAQRRAGRDGVEFTLLKFRTMKVSSRRGSGLTRAGDSRITAIGSLLRRSKLDELPQLINVLKGEMSLVGPRPDLKEFWNQAAPEHRIVLSLTPGITGAASLAFSSEEKLLANIPADELNAFYINQLLPTKARLDTEYAAQATFISDCGVVLRTVCMPLVRLRHTAGDRNEMETR